MVAEREHDADALQRNLSVVSRRAGGGLEEDQRDLLDSGAGEIGELGRPELERIALSSSSMSIAARPKLKSS